MYNMWRQPITTAIPGEVAEVAEYFDPLLSLVCGEGYNCCCTND